MSGLSDDLIPLSPSSRYIDLGCLGRTDWRSGFKGLAWIISFRILGEILGIVIAVAFARRFSFELRGPIGLLVSESPMIVGLIVGVRYAVVRSQRRPFWSLIGSPAGFAHSRLLLGIAIALAVNAVIEELLAVETGGAVDWLDGPFTAPYLLSALANATFIIFQAASEEFVFRGWLTQWLGQSVRSRVALILIVASLFAVCHGFRGGPLGLPYFMLASVEYSILSLRDGRLELAIGAHIACNWLLLAPSPGELPSLFAGPGDLIELSDLAEAVMELVIVCGAAELLRHYRWLTPSAAPETAPPPGYRG